MCKGISILRARIRQELYEQHQMADRIRSRGGEEELHFMYTDKVVMLPVEYCGQTIICEWGNRGNKESRLPRTGWCRNESLEAGKWQWLKPEAVVIPADFGLEKGVWFQIIEGMRGVLVRDEEGKPHVYMLTRQASHYYQTMTKHERMPVLVDQEI
jgi:hypothetical protein